MAIFTGHTKKIIIRIDEFIDKVEDGLLIFREAIGSYLQGNKELFDDYLGRIDKLESAADNLHKSVQNDLIIHSILPQYRSGQSSG